MLENIRRIGLFMIAAQAVIHFAPGRQYEKYIKLVSSVIILFLFIRPFASGQMQLEGEWSQRLEQAVEEFEEEDLWQPEGLNMDDRALAELEKEIKYRFNEKIADEIYYVESVSLIFEKDEMINEGEEYDLRFQNVKIVMEKKGEVVESIIIGGEREGEEKDVKAALHYREIFAGILGIEPDRVEVTCVGGW